MLGGDLLPGAPCVEASQAVQGFCRVPTQKLREGGEGISSLWPQRGPCRHWETMQRSSFPS